MMKQEDSMKQALGSVTIKTEPGTSTSIMQRLPSLRPPRDLALSAYSQKNQAKNKKVYIPNLNVQRNKPSETVTIKSEPGIKPTTPDNQMSVRGRGRAKRQIVQLGHGLFADGIPGQKNTGRGRSGFGGGDKTDSILRKPTLKLKENVKVDKQEEENTMKQLLKDDFVDDPTLEPDFEHCPIILPLLNCKEDCGLKKRSDLKPVDKKEFNTISDVFPEGPAPVDPGYMLWLLPSTMPGVKLDHQRSLPSKPTTSSAPSQPDDNKRSATAFLNMENVLVDVDRMQVEVEKERCQLTTLPGGQIGKLQILKSGRARLVFGQAKLWLEMGTQVAFKQELMSVQLDKETHSGHTINLGPTSLRMVATPDWKSLV